MNKRIRKQELRTDEIHEIISSPPNFLTKWGTSIVIMIMIIFISLSFYISYPLVVRGKVRFTSVSQSSIECLILIEPHDMPKLHIGQKVIIENKAKNEMLVGKVDSVFNKMDFQIKATFPIGQDKIDGNVSDKNVRIIVGKFYLGNKILNSFMNLFIKNSDELD